MAQYRDKAYWAARRDVARSYQKKMEQGEAQFHRKECEFIFWLFALLFLFPLVIGSLFGD